MKTFLQSHKIITFTDNIISLNSQINFVFKWQWWVNRLRSWDKIDRENQHFKQDKFDSNIASPATKQRLQKLNPVWRGIDHFSNGLRLNTNVWMRVCYNTQKSDPQRGRELFLSVENRRNRETQQYQSLIVIRIGKTFPKNV